MLAYSEKLHGDNIAIIPTAGGVGVITADNISSRINGVGMKLVKLKRETKLKIRETIVLFASANNPTYLTADGSNEDFDKAIRPFSSMRRREVTLAPVASKTAFATAPETMIIPISATPLPPNGPSLLSDSMNSMANSGASVIPKTS